MNGKCLRSNLWAVSNEVEETSQFNEEFKRSHIECSDIGS